MTSKVGNGLMIAMNLLGFISINDPIVSLHGHRTTQTVMSRILPSYVWTSS